ncbi:MAG: biotin/lipoyl-containing protein, partial [Bacteroidota bacterium]
MIEQKLPSLGEGVEKGIIVSILVKEGESVELDQPLMELETDKVTVEIPAELAGVVEKILVKVGDEIPQGTPLIKIIGSGESATAPPIETIHSEPELPEAEIKEIPPVKEETQSLTSPPISIAKHANAQRNFRASPLARKMAREIGIDIKEVSPSRPSGRIAVQDVKDFAKALNQGRSQGSARKPTVSLPDF